MTALQPKRTRLPEAMAVALGQRVETVRGWCAEAALQTDAEGVAIHLNDAIGFEPWAITDPRAAWEALATAGLIGAEDVESPRRGFVGATRCLYCRGQGRANRGQEPCPTCKGTGRGVDMKLPHPDSVADCVALAADWPGVLAAEAAAQQHVREAAWYPQRERLVAWRVMDAAETENVRRAAEIDARLRAEAPERYAPDEARDALVALGYRFHGAADAIRLVAPSL